MKKSSLGTRIITAGALLLAGLTVACNAAAEAAITIEPGNCDYRYFAAMAAAYSIIDAAHHQDQARMEQMGKMVLAHLDTILIRNPDHHEARYFLVQQSLDMAPDLGLAAPDVAPHVALLEEKAPILGAKARCCLASEEEQRKIWQEILMEYPDNCHALVEAAEGLIAVGELDKAQACLERAIKKDKQNCYGLLRLGLAHAMREDWDRAIDLTQQYLETEPPVALRAFALDRMGILLQRKGDVEKGRELMSQARAVDPHVWHTVMPPPREIFLPLES